LVESEAKTQHEIPTVVGCAAVCLGPTSQETVEVGAGRTRIWYFDASAMGSTGAPAVPAWPVKDAPETSPRRRIGTHYCPPNRCPLGIAVLLWSAHPNFNEQIYWLDKGLYMLTSERRGSLAALTPDCSKGNYLINVVAQTTNGEDQRTVFLLFTLRTGISSGSLSSASVGWVEVFLRLDELPKLG
jgi:hypothetical protein